MKTNPSISIFLTILFFCLLTHSSFAQHLNSDLQLLGEFGTISCEDLMSRLDMLAIKVQQDKESKGYMVMYPGENLIKNVVFTRALKNYHSSRGLDPQRYQLFISEPTEEFILELWVGRNGAAPKIDSNPVSLKISDKTKPYLAFQDTVELRSFEGEVSYWTHGCEVCCLFSFNVYLLRDLLEANPQTTANIGVYGYSRNDALKLRRLLKAELDGAKVPADRVEFSIWRRIPGPVDPDEFGASRNKIFRLRVWLD